MTTKQYFEEDFLDQKKEEEERLLLRAEEKEKKENEKEATPNSIPSSAKSVPDRRRTEAKTEKMERNIGSASSTTSNASKKGKD